MGSSLARHRQVVGWGHRGFGGSGTDNGGMRLRTGVNMSEVVEVLNDKPKGNVKGDSKDVKPDKKRELTEDQCPPLQYRAGVSERHKHCHRKRWSLMRIVPMNIQALTNLHIATNPL